MSAITKYDLYRIAGEAQCDPRTVRTYVEGRRAPVPLVRQSIDRALKKLGYAKRQPAEARP